MPIGALIRNLGNMTKCGLIAPGSDAAKTVCERVTETERLKRSRVHPVSVLIAMRTYQSGRGLKGSGSWEPVAGVVAAMDDAFYLAFQGIKPTGRRILVGLDVSGSMSSPLGALPISSCEAGAALSMVWAATEPECEVMGFADSFVSLGFHRKMSLSEATTKAQMRNFGRTDCAQPMLWAKAQKLDFDAFVVVTDNETWAGAIHPKVALDQYRKERVPGARQAVLGTCASEFTIADPGDPLTLDIAGFSSDVPVVLASFLGDQPEPIEESE
jgi:60 kDa SS-A/Ro ribonucleoprotein